ncbi:MAG: histidine kinase [Chitinophagaceae bacterium]
MKVKLSILFLILSFNISAQSLKIESYKNVISKAFGIDKINTLWKIVDEYHYQNIQTDSALKYARIAFNEAAALNNRTAKGRALVQQSKIYGTLLGNIKEMKRYSLMAIEELKSTGDNIQLASAYHALALSLIFQGNYDEAIGVLVKAKILSTEINDKHGLSWFYQVNGLGYVKSGQLWKGFVSLKEADRLAREIKDSLISGYSLNLIGRAFMLNGDPETALHYYREGQKFQNTSIILMWPHLEDMGYAFLQLKQNDSAVIYQQRHRHNLMALTTDTAVRRKFRVWQYPDFRIDQKIQQQKYDDVIAELEPRLADQQLKENQLPMMHALLNIGYAYAGKKNYKKSMESGKKLLQLAKHSYNNFYLREGYALMANNFEQLAQKDSAFDYFKSYIATKELMAEDQFALRAALHIANEQSKLQLDSLAKINNFNERQLTAKQKELGRASQLKNLLLISLIILGVLTILIFRNITLKRKNDRLQNEKIQLALKRKALELEMQALRAQMNPHFIFNCLSAIDNLVQTNQADKATSYLSRFAKLIRSVLDSSKNNVVSFQRDFETLKLYLEMEKFRCNNKFSYTLEADERLMNGDFKVPPLIIQPFVENAIHHGLLNKQENNRQLDISAELQDEHIVYYVSDNGIGRNQAQRIKEMNRPDQVSYGIDITRERVNIYNMNGQNDIEITDLEDKGISIGTRAMVRLHS